MASPAIPPANCNLVQIVLRLLDAFFWSLLVALRGALRMATRPLAGVPHGVAAGKTVLVTTGRQAKTVHVIRALKAVGATVVVTDYDHVSASAVSTACDHFVVLPSLDVNALDAWVDAFGKLLVEYAVDMVVPVSTINEALFLGVAKDRLSPKLPHVEWLCTGLDNVLRLDDRERFSATCRQYGVPAPASGLVTRREQVPHSASQPHGIIVKRLESSVNRDEEIVPVAPSDPLPDFVKPSPTDAWQWQQMIRGAEYSVWYVCVNGKVTFSACYLSQPDLVHFDHVPTPADVDKPLRDLIAGMHLSGQYAFDFIRDQDSGVPYVIECNPRASSILETVSCTPLWGESFFGIDVSARCRTQDVGFVFHGNCWPWTARTEGYLCLSDPLPFFAAEIAWPLHAIQTSGMSEAGYRKIDVNICKIIIDGPSAPRSIGTFENAAQGAKLAVLDRALQYVETIYIDAAVPNVGAVVAVARKASCHPVLFQLGAQAGLLSGVSNSLYADLPPIQFVASPEELSGLVAASEAVAPTRLLTGDAASVALGFDSELTLLAPRARATPYTYYRIPLRRLKVLHVMGSCTSKYYETVSSYYGFDCISSVTDDVRYEHVIGYVHLTGEWSVAVGKDEVYMREKAPRLSLAQALAAIESLSIDLMIPHMFDYAGLTAYRSVFSMLDLPTIGCSGEALALSTNKARTKACAAMDGVQVPKSQLLRRGDTHSMPFPIVIKPTEEDNSMGVEVVHNEAQVAAALESAFQFGDEVMVEQYIPLGRELRVAVIETPDGGMEMLPVVEYFLPAEKPIRKSGDKITTDSSGQPSGYAPVDRKVPADIDPVLHDKLYKLAVVSHRATDCADYSIYDVRVDPDGEPYMLESCLYCSFSFRSVLVLMADAAGKKHPQLFVEFSERSVGRKSAAIAAQAHGKKAPQEFGMKVRR